jgi:DNA-binding protein HU-alpha
MHKTDLVAVVAPQLELSKDRTSDIISTIFDEITQALSRDEAVTIPGFGAFGRRQRAARSGRNPKTGETIAIGASTSVGFKPGKALKDAVNAG